MKSNNLFAKFIITLTLVALLTVPVGRVTGVFALAAPAPELAPIFDTQIYQLHDYFEENIEGTPHEPIFYLILGCYVVLQAGMNDYQIVDPYTTSDGVSGWLKSTGIQLWNSLNSFVSFDPVTGTDLRPTLAPLIAYALGASELAYKYNSEQAFLDDVSSSDNFFLPFDQSLQMGLNAVFAQNGGLFNWQHTSSGLVFYPFTYKYLDSISLSDTSRMRTYVFDNSNGHNVYLYNSTAGYYNAFCCFALHTLNNTYQYDTCNLFVNLTSHSAYLVDNLGVQGNFCLFSPYAKYNFGSNTVVESLSYETSNLNTYTFGSSALDNVNQLLVDCCSHNYFSNVNSVSFYDIISHVYIGTSWSDRTEVTSLSFDLNFSSDVLLPYYQQVTNDYLFDIKDLLTDLTNITDLFPVILDHLFDNDGVQVVDLPTIQVSINLPDTNPLPVNLNDIDKYTDNIYLDVVKERVHSFSDTVGSFVAFWHNTDYEIVYAVFGSALIVLLGAFIGKWGHS